MHLFFLLEEGDIVGELAILLYIHLAWKLWLICNNSFQRGTSVRLSLEQASCFIYRDTL